MPMFLIINLCAGIIIGLLISNLIDRHYRVKN